MATYYWMVCGNTANTKRKLFEFFRTSTDSAVNAEAIASIHLALKFFRQQNIQTLASASENAVIAFIMLCHQRGPRNLAKAWNAIQPANAKEGGKVLLRRANDTLRRPNDSARAFVERIKQAHADRT